MEEKDIIYERKKDEIINKYSKKGRISPLGKWEIAKLFMLYYPNKEITPQEYKID